MPRYDMLCKSCSHNFEIQKSFSDDSKVLCPLCNGETRQIYSPPYTFMRDNSVPDSLREAGSHLKPQEKAHLDGIIRRAADNATR